MSDNSLPKPTVPTPLGNNANTSDKSATNPKPVFSLPGSNDKDKQGDDKNKSSQGSDQSNFSKPKPTFPLQQKDPKDADKSNDGKPQSGIPLSKPSPPPQSSPTSNLSAGVPKPSLPTSKPQVASQPGVTQIAQNKPPVSNPAGIKAPSGSLPPAVKLGMKPAGQQPRPLGAPSTPPPNRLAPTGQLGKPPQPGTPPSSVRPSTGTSSTGAMRPPANLTALSNVSSNKLPPGATASQPTPPKAPPPQKKAVFATAGSSSPLMKYLPYIVGGVVIFIVLILIISSLFSGGSDEATTTPARSPVPQASVTPDTGRQPVTDTSASITYWGLWEPEEVMSEIISDFEKENPGISVQYVKQSHQDYRERLQLAIASGQGPDVFRFHSSWVPMLREELYPVPASVMSSSEFQASYYPVMASQLQNNGQFVGVPLMYDGLALFYNEDILNTANAQPPQTWSELRSLAAKLTIRNGEEIKRGGVALGNATNVEHFSDILAVLMLQNGADLTRPNSPEGKDALKFYTNFVKADKVWDSTLPSSTVAFARGDVAMMFAPSWRAHEVKNINPNLHFKVTTLPRLAETRIAWATYWAEGVNSKSKNVDAAWKLIEYLARQESLQKMYSSQSSVRSFGELYPRVNMAGTLATDPVIAPFLQDAPYAKGWYMSSFTHDNGINDNIIKYYEDAVTAVLGTTSAEDAMVTVEQGVQQQLRQYNAL